MPENNSEVNQSNPQTEKPLTQEQLFAQASRDEQLKIASLPWDTNPSEAMEKLIARFRQLENISLEAKIRATEAAKKMRQVEASSGKNRWDKERRGEVKGNLSDPRNSPLLSAAQKKHKSDLNKVEKLVQGFIDLGYDDSEIMDAIPEGKFKGHEVRAAITKLR